MSNALARRPPIKVLVVASAPFGGLPTSASHEVAKILAAIGIDGADLTVSILPVDYDAIPVIAAELIDRIAPDVAIGIGVELGAPTIRLETTALNFADFAIADNLGRFIRDTVPFPGEPEACTGTWDAPIIAARVRATGIPAIVSHHAGTHLCNLTYFSLIRRLARVNPGASVGYVHLPLLPAQVADFISNQDTVADTAPTTDAILPSMPLDMQVAGVRMILKFVIDDIARREHKDEPVMAANS
jgi:pyroglutamyl-peptidase